MKNAKSIIALCLLFFSFNIMCAQNLIRTPFLEIGDKPLVQQIVKTENKGYSMSTVKSLHLDQTVKEAIARQKSEAFKKADKATVIVSKDEALYANYPIESGYTYRIIAVTYQQSTDFILRAIDESKEFYIPDATGNSSYNTNKNMVLQLQDIVCKKNKIIIIQNGTVSNNQYEVSPVRYLIFKKKS